MQRDELRKSSEKICRHMKTKKEGLINVGPKMIHSHFQLQALLQSTVHGCSKRRIEYWLIS